MNSFDQKKKHFIKNIKLENFVKVGSFANKMFLVRKIKKSIFMFLKCMFILNLFLWSFMENPFVELKRHATMVSDVLFRVQKY